MILVFAAMDPEVGACFGGSPPAATADVDGHPLYESSEMVVCKTGIGRRSAAVADAALLRYSPEAVLSVGVAGGLAPDIEAGDLVICRHVDHESHRHSDEEMSVYADDRLLRDALEIAAELNLPVSEGSSLTVDEAAWGPADKAAHHAWKRHEIVEMESFWVGASAAKRGSY